ncbi:MAG: amino acid adenylation domain-containing protein [Acidobacteriota bacterium]|nr:amino acid adenylation domain-containing protein [Acidobacteriota bacterium]
MRLLLVQNTTWVPALGGASKGNRLLLEDLARRGHRCAAVAPAVGVQVGLEDRSGFHRALAERGIDVLGGTVPGTDRFHLEGVEVHAVHQRGELAKAVGEAAQRLQPDWILVSSEDTGQVLLEAALEAAPERVVYLARTTFNLPFGPDSFAPSEARREMLGRAAGIACISDFLRDYIRRWGGLDAKVLRLPVLTLGTGPFPDFGARQLEASSLERLGAGDRFVTMINPCAVKGISIFLPLAESLPEVSFAAVPTWGTTAEDRRRMEALPNVTVLDPVDDIDEIFARTRVLLMPSLWHEAYGRSTVEALLRGLPVLASDVGGLPEAKLGVEPLLPVRPLEGYTNAFDERNLPVAKVPEQDIGPWREALTRLLQDDEHYRRVAAESRAAAHRLLEETSMDGFQSYLETLAERKEAAAVSAEDPAEEPAKKEASKAADLRTLLALRALRKRKQQSGGEERPRGIPTVPRDGPLPLSFTQQRVFFFERWEPGTAAFNLPLAVRLRGQLRPAVLRRVLATVLERHEVLRSRFQEQDGEGVQIAAPAPRERNVPLPLVDLSGLAETGASELAQELADDLTARAGRRPLDLAAGRLIEGLLLRLGAEDHIAALTVHHIAADGWSLGVLLAEIRTLYEAYSKGGSASPLLPLPIQYADFAVWQRRQLEGEALERLLGYWQRALEDAPETLELPTDRPRSQSSDHRGRTLKFALPGATVAAVRKLAEARDVTPFMVYNTLYHVLLGRLAGQGDTVTGVLVAGRRRPEVQGLLGYFSNTLPLRLRRATGSSLVDALGPAKKAVLEAFEHEDLPFERLVEELNPDRRLPHHPVFQVLFALQNLPTEALQLPGLELEPLIIDRGAAHLDLFLSLAERGEGAEGSLEYDRDLFDATTARRWAQSFAVLVAAALAEPHRPLEDLPLLPAAQRHQLVAEQNAVFFPETSSDGTGEEIPETLHGLVAALMENESAADGEAPAVIWSGGVVSYGELWGAARRLAHRLRRRGVGPGSRVALRVDRRPAVIVAMLGTLQAGAAYVPVDPDYPEARQRQMLEDCGAALLLTTQALLATTPDCGIPELLLDDALQGGPAPVPLPAVQAADAAYLIYTSGSTGEAKGTVISHGAAVHYVRGALATYGLTAADRMLQFCSVSFDTSIEEIFPTLAAGGALVLRSEAMLDAGELLLGCAEHGVTVATLPTAFWHQLVADLETKRDLETKHEAAAPASRSWFPPSLRLLIIGGEGASQERLDAWRRLAQQHGGRPRLLNTYGPTEGTVVATAADAGAGNRGAGDDSIGRPLPGVAAHVLDPRGAPVPLGVLGELYLGGGAIARGYLGRPRLTADAFRPDPFSNPLSAESEGARLYATGDFVRRLADGRLEFRGRRDQQLKIRGYRVELGEVEAALGAHPAVREALVIARSGAAGLSLGAYVVVGGAGKAEETAKTAAEVHRFLRRRIPGYMLPAAYAFLDQLPCTPVGKIDRRSLERGAKEASWVVPSGTAEEGEGAAPRSELEHRLAEIWCEVLGVEAVGIHDGFFDLGGHSLLAMQLISRVRGVCGYDLSLRRLFEHPTVAELARLLEEGEESQEAAPALPPIPAGSLLGEFEGGGGGELELSFAQERLWFLEQLDPGSTAYNLPSAVELRGELEPARLARAFRSVVARHAVLRSELVEHQGSPRQRVRRRVALPLPAVDLGALPEESRRRELHRLVARDARRPFDLGRAPLLRLTLVRLEKERHALLFAMHHLISDGWSMALLLREVGEHYAAGGESELAPLAVQYPDYAAWQRGLLEGEALEGQLEYWRERLQDAPPALVLPRRRRPLPESAPEGGTEWLVLPAELVESLGGFARQRGATLFMVLLAAFQALLRRTTAQGDLSVGVPVAGRPRQELEPLIGFFVNTLVLRARVPAKLPFGELLEQARDATLEAYARQDLPFERLVAELNPERDLARSPLFQVMFALQEPPVERLELPGLVLEPLRVESGTTRFELFFELLRQPDGSISAALHFATALFERTLAQRLGRHYRRLLEAVLEQPDSPVARLPLLSPAERQQVLWEWNDSAVTLPAETFLELFDAVVRMRAPAVAVRFRGEALTYGELSAHADALAERLAAAGIGPGDLVALLAHRSTLFLVTMLAVFRRRAAYLPLDPRHPAARSQQILEASSAGWLLVDGAHGERGGELAAAVPGLQVVPLEAEAAPSTPPSALPSALPSVPSSPPRHDDLAYTIFTSGSTGKPKGAMVMQGGMVNHLLAKIRDLQLGPADRLAQTASQCFDISVWQFLAMAVVGGEVHVFEDEVAHDPAELLRRVEDQAVTVLETVPSILRMMLDGAVDAPGLARLRWLVPTGEALPPELARRWQERYPRARLVNAYGPTECSDDVSHAFLPTHLPPELATVPIGRPVVNTQLYVLGPGGLPAPVEVAGELWVGGLGVGRGYLDEPRRTAEVFRPDPFAPALSGSDLFGRAGARLYRTGDLARYLPEGELDFLGRIDHQVKVRGHRIELGEIEAVLSRGPGVAQAVVLALPDARGDQTLAAFVVRREGSEDEDLEAFLRPQLPEYMVPAAILTLDELPLSANGKVDRKALAAQQGELALPEREYLAPRTDVEEAVAEIFQQVVGVEPVGALDNFFHLGGHSLLATQAMARLRELFEIELPLRLLFEAPTVAELAAEIEDLVIAELEELSEEEASALLMEEA